MSIRTCALQSDAFIALKKVWEHRDIEAQKWRAQGKKVIGKLGFDVPDELLIAAGMLPVQVYADPERSLNETNKYLEYAFEPVVRAQFEKLIDGTYGEQLDVLAISNSTDVVIRIFLYLRELHRVEPEKKLPPLAFIDWLFTRTSRHQARNEFVIDLFRKQVEEWAGREVTDEEIREAGKICNENRQAPAGNGKASPRRGSAHCRKRGSRDYRCRTFHGAYRAYRAGTPGDRGREVMAGS